MENAVLERAQPRMQKNKLMMQIANYDTIQKKQTNKRSIMIDNH